MWASDWMTTPLRLGGRGDCRNKPAPPVVALGKDCGHITLDDAKFLDLRVDSMQYGFEPPALGSAGGGTEIIAVETVDDLDEGEAHVLQRSGETNPLDSRLGVDAISGWPPLRLRQDPAPFVEADRVNADACALSDLADSHA